MPIGPGLSHALLAGQAGWRNLLSPAEYLGVCRGSRGEGQLVSQFRVPPSPAPWRLSLSAPKYVDQQKLNNNNNNKKNIRVWGTGIYFY